MRRSWSAAIAFAVLATTGAPAAAQAPLEEEETVVTSPPDADATLRWNERWERPGWPHVAVSVACAALGVTAFLLDLPDEPRWSRTNTFDDSIHDDLALDNQHDRELAASVSDMMLNVLLAFPVIVDSLIVAGLLHRSEDVALQTALISGEVLTYAFLLQMLSRHAARERPFVGECAGDPSYAAGCGGDGNARNASFVSGHALMAFASASTICVNHIHLRLYGSEVADGVACATALSVAGAVGVLRLNADRHWITDVLAGGSIGLLVGWLAPWLLHYAPLRGTTRVALVPGAPNADVGLSVAGSW